MAIDEEYFKPIDFIAFEEYDDNLVDKFIANNAISNLELDFKNGYNHILLVRANTIDRAEYLCNNIYSKYSKFDSVLITSKVKASEKRGKLNKIKSCDSKIVVCVDMFGEGIDIPNLKIAALHDKYKSLPITLQFIGRFARSKKELGTTKVIANIADVNIMDSLKELYEKDADWNKLLPIKYEKNIQDKLSLQEMISGFDNMSSEIDLKQIRPKISMKAYSYKDNIDWYPNEWINVLDESNCRSYINSKEKIIILVEPFSSCQAWTTQKNIESLNWNFYIIYWNQNKKYVCINASDYQKGNELLKHIFDDALIPVRSEVVFRCLANVKRLVFASVGLNSAIDGPVRYKMFAGIDVAEGISESNKNNCYKSNVFGMGYEGDGRISIGCSYKGKIWSRWVENISFWKNWCDKVMEKILDHSNDSKILDSVLIPEVIIEVPKDIIAYRIDFEEGVLRAINNILISTTLKTYNIQDCELRIGDCVENKQFFQLICNDEIFDYYLQIEKDRYEFYFSGSNKADPEVIKSGGAAVRLSRYFYDNPPIIWYVGTSSLQGNVLLRALTQKDSFFPDSNFIRWDWKSLNVDIQVESQLDIDGSKKTNSIQYGTINSLKESKKYSIILMMMAQEK
ncbi:DEAD/DEAH box helicase [Clostridium ihumii]|uniref:DEAD/DEAH box helicase n=1 Tax=Clostridium ihumii TaxID=1470356 RepID=UPI003D348BDC